MSAASMKQTYELIFEVRKYPYLYDERHPAYNNKEVQSIAWEMIAANVYKAQWGHLTQADKAMKAKQLQTKLTSEDYDFLVGMNRTQNTLDSGAAMTESVPSSSQDNATAGDVQSLINDLEAKKQATIDEDQELLLLYLLPTYKLLSITDKRDALHQCYCIMKTVCSNIANVKSEFPVNIKLEHSTPIVNRGESIMITDSDEEHR